MPIPLGVLAVAGAGAGPSAGAAYELLETVVLGSNQAEIDFTNLGTNYGSTYKHLQIRMTHRAANSTRSDNIYLRFNGDTTGYALHFLYGNGSSVASGGSANQTSMIVGRATGATSGANIFGAAVFDILDWNNSNKNTTVRSFTTANDGTDNTVWLFSGLWIDTGAVTSINLHTGAGDFVTGSRISLYGLRSS